MKFTSNLTQNRQKTQNVQKDKKVVLEKNLWKMQTSYNPVLNKIMEI